MPKSLETLRAENEALTASNAAKADQLAAAKIPAPAAVSTLTPIQQELKNAEERLELLKQQAVLKEEEASIDAGIAEIVGKGGVLPAASTSKPEGPKTSSARFQGKLPI